MVISFRKAILIFADIIYKNRISWTFIQFIDFIFLHIDVHLQNLIAQYGNIGGICYYSDYLL